MRRNAGFAALLTALAFYPAQARGQGDDSTGVVTGTVYAAETGAPMPGLTVWDVGLVLKSTKTDLQGRYRLDHLGDGQAIISVTAPGRLGAARTVYSTWLWPDTVDFRLERFTTDAKTLLASGACVVTGTVTAAKSGAAEAAVEVHVLGTSQGVTTDQSGHYRLTVRGGTYRPGGQYQIVVGREGLAPAMRVVVLTPGATVTQNFVLGPSANSLSSVRKPSSKATAKKR